MAGYANTHETFMLEAVREAEESLKRNEVPVGAVVVWGDEIVGRGRNMKEYTADPTSHAEMIAIREASIKLGRWRLKGSAIYVTKEPCLMCMGAILEARISSLVFGCYDPKGGALDARLTQGINITAGVCAYQSGSLLREFFMSLRKKNGRDNSEKNGLRRA